MATYPINPAWRWPDKIRGIFVGGCITYGEGHWPTEGETAAHAHLRDPNKGWICVTEDRFLLMVDGSGRPNPVLTHEAAHIVTGQAHSKRWAATAVAMGGVVLPEEIEPYRQPTRYRREV